MLLSTFQHIAGVGRKTELSLWKQGITSWDKYSAGNGVGVRLSRSALEVGLDASRKALRQGDIAFFARSLPTSEQYRVALTYPEQTLFLDIETTGLSLYYDALTIVGWSLGRMYGVYVDGQDITALRGALRSAKAVVTFNGTLFDTKFINKTFPELVLPPAHIDLRFLAKRVGLSGGQKKLEVEIGFTRPLSIQAMKGEAAPILWHQYRRGDKSALKKLILYNHSDIEGMKWLFDYAVRLLYERDAIPKPVRSRARFSTFRSTLDWGKGDDIREGRVLIYKYSRSAKPLITYENLNAVLPLDQLTVVGIDLVSSERKKSGYCVLQGNEAETCRIATDNEMVRRAIEAGADIVSIDSPLSLPKSRRTITRECERILRKRGINVYPCLIPSMRKLTKRGVRLAAKFRKLGIPVIESYPGAAQDIMGIPRKRAGIEYLRQGLSEFGIRGNYTDGTANHDELDAITSAVVGLFFWTGMFEALGNLDEEYLIIPRLDPKAGRSWLSRRVLGLSGAIGSGKSTAAQYCARRGYRLARFSSVLEEMLARQKKRITRTNLQRISAQIRKKRGQRWLGNQVVAGVTEQRNIVIDGLRFLEDHALMVETFGPAYKHIHIDAPLDIRQRRRSESKRDDIRLEKAERASVEAEIIRLRGLADHIIMNKGSLATLRRHLKPLAG